MRHVVIRPVAALLLSVSLLVLGNGLLGTLLVLRAGEAGFRGETIGAMMSIYFAGYALGMLLLPRVVSAAGNIRSFAGFGAIASAVALMHLLQSDAWAWTLLRAITGFAYAGMILATESWLNAHALPTTRGRLLSIYGVLTMGVWALSQEMLNLAPTQGVVLFLAASMLVSLSMVPITLLPGEPPALVHQAPMQIRRLLRISPLGTVGAFASGLALGGFWGMGPNFAQRIGLDTAGISSFMAAVLVGAMVLQWPLGWLSDRGPRRMVIAGASFGAAAAGFGIALTGSGHVPTLLVLGFLFGGFGIPLYMLCVAHAYDRLPRSAMLGSARDLLLLNGLGTALSPLVTSLVMSLLGPGGLFLFAAVVLSLLMLLALARHQRGPEEGSCPIALPSCPQIAMALDTRGADAIKPATTRTSRSGGRRSD
jgi:MFS family permease